jgi:hypothetical protein
MRRLTFMATEFTVILPDTPGSLARLGQALGDARVNIEAIQGITRGVVQGITRGGEGLVRFVPDNPSRTARALDAAGLPHTTREILVVGVLDEPGALGEVALVMATAGINIDSVYVTTRGYVVLGVDDLAGAIHVAAGMAVMIGE